MSALARYIQRWQNARGRGPFFLLILLGAISVLGHAPFYFAPVFLLCFALFWLRIDGMRHWENRPKRALFWSGWAFGFGYFLMGLYWIGSAFIVRGGIYVWIMPLCVPVLPAFLALFWAIPSALYGYVKSTRLWIGALVFGLLIFAFEWLRGHILSGLPWNLPGYIFEGGKPISQSASLFGIYGLSFLTLLLGAALGPILKQPKKGAAFFAIMLAAFIGLFGWGTWRLSSVTIANTPSNTKVRVVQAQIDQTKKFDPAYYDTILDRYIQLSYSEGIEDIDLIVWPEGAIPGLVLERQAVMEQLISGLRPGQTLVFGVTRRDSDNNYFNSMVAITMGAEGRAMISATYDKNKLVPFGEFFPGGELVQKMGIPSLSAAVSSFTRGEIRPFSPEGLPPANAQICYEIIFPGFADLSTNPRPEYILNISNDAWYGRSTGPWQHINQVKYRAIETGLPVVRSASNGVSGMIDPMGRRLEKTSPYELTVIDQTLPNYLE